MSFFPSLKPANSFRRPLNEVSCLYLALLLSILIRSFFPFVLTSHHTLMWTALLCYTLFAREKREREIQINVCTPKRYYSDREMMLSMCFNWIRIIIITKRHICAQDPSSFIHSFPIPTRFLFSGDVHFPKSFMKRIHSYDIERKKERKNTCI